MKSQYILVLLVLTLNLMFLKGKETCSYDIYGMSWCGYYLAACRHAGDANLVFERHPYSDRAAWLHTLSELNQKYATQHRTSPYIIKRCPSQPDRFVGGYTDLVAQTKSSQ